MFAEILVLFARATRLDCSRKSRAVGAPIMRMISNGTSRQEYTQAGRSSAHGRQQPSYSRANGYSNGNTQRNGAGSSRGGGGGGGGGGSGGGGWFWPLISLSFYVF